MNLLDKQLITVSGVTGYIDNNGTAQLDLENVSRGLGFVQTAASGNEVVRWERVRKYLEEINFIPTRGDGKPVPFLPRFIPENIFYRLAFKASNKTAVDFQAKVADEILPTIRKTGGYVSDSSKFIESYFPQLETSQKSVLNTMLEETRKMGEKIKADAPKVLFADSVAGSNGSILIRDMAKLLKQNGVEIGEKRFYKYLRANGYLICAKGRDYNSPSQKSMELKIMEKKETVINLPDREPIVKQTPLITGKGQTYFINKFAKIMAEIKKVD